MAILVNPHPYVMLEFQQNEYCNEDGFAYLMYTEHNFNQLQQKIQYYVSSFSADRLESSLMRVVNNIAQQNSTVINDTTMITTVTKAICI